MSNKKQQAHGKKQVSAGDGSMALPLLWEHMATMS